MGHPQPEQAPHLLAAELDAAGLDAHPYTSDDHTYIHVSPPHAPSAGTDILCTPTPRGWTFTSEWGDAIGDHLTAVTAHVLFLFGKKPSPRH